MAAGGKGVSRPCAHIQWGAPHLVCPCGPQDHCAWNALGHTSAHFNSSSSRYTQPCHLCLSHLIQSLGLKRLMALSILREQVEGKQVDGDWFASMRTGESWANGSLNSLCGKKERENCWENPGSSWEGGALEHSGPSERIRRKVPATSWVPHNSAWPPPLPTVHIRHLHFIKHKTKC